jgi:hypothetical protein
MGLGPVPPARIVSIVDELFLPVVQGQARNSRRTAATS